MNAGADLDFVVAVAVRALDEFAVGYRNTGDALAFGVDDGSCQVKYFAELSHS